MKATPDPDGHRNSEQFVLQNDPPRAKRRPFVSNGGQQEVLFSGMDCLPGQKDLFETDGQIVDDE